MSELSHAQLIVISAKVSALESGFTNGLVDAAFVRSEAKELLARPDLTDKNLRDRLEILIKTVTPGVDPQVLQ